MAVSPFLAAFLPQSYAKKMPWQARSGRLFLAIPAAMGYHAASGPPQGLPSQILNVMTPVLNPTTRIYVDADACPVKDEIYRVAARHRLSVSVVAGQFIRVPPDPMIERIAAGSGMDAADDWIAERAGKGDIVI